VLRPKQDGQPSESCKEAVAAALGLLGCSAVKWKNGTAHFESAGERIQLGAEVLPEWVREIAPPIELERIAIALSDVTGLNPPRTVATDLSLVRERLYPRAVCRSAFEGPERAMCRREIGPDIYAAIWMAIGRSGLWLTTAELDQWTVDFESAFVIAKENLTRAVVAGSINEISDGQGVTAVLVEGVDLSGAMLDLPAIIPDSFAKGGGRGHGALVAAPIIGTLLMLPLEQGGGAEGIASIVQIADMLRDEEDASEIERRLYWARPDRASSFLGYTLQMLPVTVIQEDNARRAHVDSTDLVKDLLRILGELD